MKVLLYLEAEEYLKKSGIGRAIKHQEKALQIAGIDYTTNPTDDFEDRKSTRLNSSHRL